MKKPFLQLKSFGDYFKIVLCIGLCALALTLFKGDEAISVFSDGTTQNRQSLYNLLGSYI